ncbi:ABC transporter ATP-binding protein [Solidesulfovibrio magneticus]|uniref:ABC transporter ATP-binding protein n=1 Tax=Solidesulfovibrio magneticus (strain ATCC 700980 / DSM 13731 / RS-1) TaxID=573370 RepID=C4XLW2_SOLM1|nr:ABC transporter ATP-binding protein [Solidesulfovibrio magneticus]BAH74700.1 ABC transporter ATP-binding protein [Solidesulfovibrio magneticus RS-1]HML56355.1 ABC transporter ATP-binding protein [Solidesulfovibrio magneticus]
MALLDVKEMTQYFGGLCAVSEFTVALEQGQMAALIGPNGAGKTTVFNLVSGFYKPTRGEIIFDGQSIKGLKPHQVTSRGIARTFQNIRLWFEMTVLDNIRIAQHHALGYGLFDCFLRTPRYMQRERDIEDHAMEVLSRLGLAEVAHELPKNLPYGVQRLVEIARALSIKPKLLMLDEPAAGLNSADVEGLIKLIGDIHRDYGIAIWMIEHQMDVVMSLCSWIKVIDFGATIAEGTPEGIQNNPDVIKAYLGDDTI